ncbi:MAG: TRAP transporter small permease [Burkholderiaceae bacterium]
MPPPAAGEARARADGPVLRWIERVIKAIDVSGALIVGTTLTAMFVGLLINVILRYALGEGITWAYEITRILFPWMVAGGVVMATARGRHVAVTVLSDALPASTARWLTLGIYLLVGAISVAVLTTGQPIMNASRFQRLSETGISQIWGYRSLSYAFVCISVLSALNVLRILIGGAEPTTSQNQTSFS